MFSNIPHKSIMTSYPWIVAKKMILNKAKQDFIACTNLRNYLKWTARKPSKVQLPDEVSSKLEEASKEQQNQQMHRIKNQIDKPKKLLHIVEDKEYDTLKEDDSTFSKLMMQVGNRSGRKKNRLMMLEGKRLNQDALNAGLKPLNLFFTQKSYLSELQLPHKVPLFKIHYKTIQLWSKLECPPGIVGFYPIPKEGEIQTRDTLPVRVLCDNVREPGNMGSILRVAASVGCKEVLLMKGCTDPWDSKVLRSASGGHFHIPIKSDLTWQEQYEFLLPNDSIILADNSLNRPFQNSQTLSQLMYYEPIYCSLTSLVVIIGGETEGVSQEALALASKYKGTRVYIPMSNGMESLNTGTALSVLLYEIKRQFLLREYSETSEAPKSGLESSTEHLGSSRDP